MDGDRAGQMAGGQVRAAAIKGDGVARYPILRRGDGPFGPFGGGGRCWRRLRRGDILHLGIAIWLGRRRGTGQTSRNRQRFAIGRQGWVKIGSQSKGGINPIGNLPTEWIEKRKVHADGAVQWEVR